MNFSIHSMTDLSLHPTPTPHPPLPTSEASDGSHNSWKAAESPGGVFTLCSLVVLAASQDLSWAWESNHAHFCDWGFLTAQEHTWQLHPLPDLDSEASSIASAAFYCWLSKKPAEIKRKGHEPSLSPLSLLPSSSPFSFAFSLPQIGFSHVVWAGFKLTFLLVQPPIFGVLQACTTTLHRLSRVTSNSG